MAYGSDAAMGARRTTVIEREQQLLSEGARVVTLWRRVEIER